VTQTNPELETYNPKLSSDMPEEYILRRKARHKATIKKGILEAARTLAIENGWRNVSIRKIAKAIEYSPPVIYQHFENKEHVLKTLQDEGFEKLSKMIEKGKSTAFQRELQLVNISLAYWQFSLAYPELYQVMFNLEGVYVSGRNTNAQLRRAGKPAHEILFHMTSSPSDLEEVFFNWCAIVHGFISITMSQRLPPGSPQEQEDKTTKEKYLRHAITRFISHVKFVAGQ
jgi:AcrR family transcriptional regulator